MNQKTLSDKPYFVTLFDKVYQLECLKKAVAPNPETLYIHVQSFKDLQIFSPFLPYIHGLEIKPDGFKAAESLFRWQGNFTFCENNFDRLINSPESTNHNFQFHFPFKDIAGIKLNLSNRADHEKLYEVFEVYAQVISKYGLGPNITIHPPEIPDHHNPQQIAAALHTANEFFIGLGKKIVQNNWPMLIGIENQPDPFINNYPLDALGYRVEHFACLLKDTNEKIQLTIDSGHRNLSTEITVTNLINFAKNTEKQIINFHFHENKGIVPAVTAAGGSCDGHELAIPEHIHGFTNYLVRSVFENIPLNLEIKTRNYSPIKLFQYISGLHQTLHYIYNEIKKQQSL